MYSQFQRTRLNDACFRIEYVLCSQENKSCVSIFTSHNWEQGSKMGWMGFKTQNSKSIFLCMVSKQCVVVKVGQSSVKENDTSVSVLALTEK